MKRAKRNKTQQKAIITSFIVLRVLKTLGYTREHTSIILILRSRINKKLRGKKVESFALPMILR